MFQGFKNFLFDRDVDINERLSTWFVVSGVLVSILGVVICILANVPLLGIGCTAFMTIFAIINLILYRIINKGFLVTLIMPIGVMTIIPIIWLTVGASTGGATVWFVYGLYYIALTCNRSRALIYISVTLILDSLCFYIEHVYYDKIFHFASDDRLHLTISSVGSFVTAGVAIFVTVLLVLLLYNHEKITTDSREKELEKANKALEDANAAQKSFLANMSHEIRTPINAVLGLDEIIIRESNDDEIKKYAYDIQGAGKSLLSLVNGILDFSKIEAGKLELQIDKYHLNSLINDVYNMSFLNAQEKHLKIIVTNEPDIPNELIGDEVRFRQILTNIMSNAVKYTNEGSITMHLASEKINDENIILTISIKDTGRGIKPESIPILFDSFQRVDENKNRYIEGTGLGLSITKNLVDIMNGSIKVESTYGEGSTFTVMLPQQVAGSSVVGRISDNFKNRVITGETYRESFKASDADILVVDDVAMNISVLAGLLKKTGINIDTANCGEHAVSKAHNKKYDLIFMDHMMPGMDGIEAFNLIRNDDSSLSKNTPTVILTANAVAGAKDEYLKVGFSGYLSKPVAADALEKMIIEQLPKDKVVLTEDRSVAIEQMSVKDRFSFLNVSEAMKYCMNKEKLFIQMLEMYVGDHRVNELHMALDEEDMDLYRTYAHAVKSTSKSIGALDFADESYEMEKEAKANNLEYIKEHHEQFVEHYEALMLRIEQELNSGENNNG